MFYDCGGRGCCCERAKFKVNGCLWVTVCTIEGLAMFIDECEVNAAVCYCHYCEEKDIRPQSDALGSCWHF